MRAARHMARHAALWAAAALLVACEQEPSFDERYDTAEETIRRKATEIDRDLRAAERDRLAAASPAGGQAAAPEQSGPQD